MGLGVQRDSRTTLPRGKTRCQLYKRPGGGGSGPFWTGEENHAPTSIRSLDRPARSESL